MAVCVSVLTMVRSSGSSNGSTSPVRVAHQSAATLKRQYTEQLRSIERDMKKI